VLKEAAYGLGAIKARDKLLSWYELESDENIKLDIVNALHGNYSEYPVLCDTATSLYCSLLPDLTSCDARKTVRTLLGARKKLTGFEERECIALMLYEIGSVQALDALLSWGLKEKDQHMKELIVGLTFKLSGYKVFSLWQKDLAALNILVTISIDEELRAINKNSDWSTGSGLTAFKAYVARFADKHEVLFSALVLSNELTKRTYGIVFQELNSSLIQKKSKVRRGRSLFSYALAKQQSALFPSFIVSLASFDKFQMFFKKSRVPINILLEKVFSEKSMQFFAENPVEFYMVLREMVMTRQPYLREVFVQHIITLSETSEITQIALQSLLANGELAAGNVSGTKGAVFAATELPVLPEVWKKPQKSWLTEDNILRVGIFWSLKNKLEKQEFSRFADIFSQKGRKVSYEGYQEIGVESIEGVAAPDRIFVKEFSGTGRTIELHLYSDAEALKTNWYPVVVSRGYSRDDDLYYTTVYKDTLRFALHSSSQKKCETLIQNNTDAAVVSVIGGEKGRDSDRIFLSFMEYLGQVDNWDSWKILKKRAFFDLPDNLPVQYRFPDDTSLRFAAYVRKIDQLKRRIVN
jgi:hypothetical protein